MKKLFIIVSVLSLILVSGCKSDPIKSDIDAEKQMEEHDTYVPWWALNSNK